MNNTGRTRHFLGLELIDFFDAKFCFLSYGVICSPESTIAGVLDLSENKTVHCRLLRNLKVRSNLQDSVVKAPTKWTAVADPEMKKGEGARSKQASLIIHKNTRFRLLFRMLECNQRQQTAAA